MRYSPRMIKGFSFDHKFFLDIKDVQNGQYESKIMALSTTTFSW